jgi:cytochrome P450
MRQDEGGAPRLGRSFIQDPHVLYQSLRAGGPVHQVVIPGGSHVWLVTDYAEARTALTDPRLTKDRRDLVQLLPSAGDHPLRSALHSHMLQRDPPDHTRLRKLVMKAFTAGTVQRMKPDIVRIADELINDLAAAAVSGSVVDLMDRYAVPLPIRVIGELLGVPSCDQNQFRSRVDRILTTSDYVEVQAAEDRLTELLSALIADKRRRPAEDLLSALVYASDVDDRLSEDELLSTAYLLIVAGYETTVNLVGNGVLALLRNPTQLAALRADASLLPRAIQEILRFGSPLNVATLRVTTEPVRIGEVEIPADQPVLIALLAANHDSDFFVTPERLDITRINNPHLAFGRGIHHCIGAPLARLEGEIAIGRLIARFDQLTLADSAIPRYRNSLMMHGLSTLPVRLSHHRPSSQLGQLPEPA